MQQGNVSVGLDMK